MADAKYNNVGRCISGWTKTKRVAGTVASEIKAGDLMVLVNAKASPASALGDGGTKAQNQEAAHDTFLGMALDAKLANDTRDILVTSTGEYKYPCAALGAAAEIGAYVGIAGTGAGGADGLADQTVEIVATANLAIGRTSRRHEIGATEIYFEMGGVLTTTHAGPQTMA